MAEPSSKHPSIRDAQSVILGRNVVESIQKDTYASCDGPATDFRNDISRREFTISGLCQSCQDRVFGAD